MPILRDSEIDIISHSEEQTRRMGMRLGGLLQAGDVICLSGDMGAGKTAFAGGIGKGWGASTPLTSPTFNLVHEHHRAQDNAHLYHLDCYRLQNVVDADSVGIDDLLSGRGVVIFEWPEQIAPILPKNRLWIELRVLELTRRSFTFTAVGKRYEELVQKFRETTFGV